MQLTDKVAIVTGGSRGIGRAISHRLAEAGAHVIIASTTLDVAETVATEIQAAGGSAKAIQTNVTNFASVKNTIVETLNLFGHIDILVNNAGGSARGKMSLFCESEEDTWDHVLNTNLKGVMYFCRGVINHMLERKQGSIVNIASVAGINGIAGQVDYSASKGAVIAFSSALAKETITLGVRVNCVSPGPTTSDAGRNIAPKMKKSLAYQTLGNATGFGHFAEPDDIAKLVTLLASDDGKFISGQNYPVCGLMNLGFNANVLG